MLSKKLFHLPVTQGRKRNPNPNFVVRISLGGVGVFHGKGWGPKIRYVLRNPGKPTFWRDIPELFLRFSCGVGAKHISSHVAQLLLNFCPTFIKHFSKFWGCWLDPVWRSQLWGESQADYNEFGNWCKSLQVCQTLLKGVSPETSSQIRLQMSSWTTTFEIDKNFTNQAQKCSILLHWRSCL